MSLMSVTEDGTSKLSLWMISHAKVLLRLAGEQRLYNEAEGPKYRQWLRYLLEALVPLDQASS